MAPPLFVLGRRGGGFLRGMISGIIPHFFLRKSVTIFRYYFILLPLTKLKQRDRIVEVRTLICGYEKEEEPYEGGALPGCEPHPVCICACWRGRPLPGDLGAGDGQGA